MRLIQNGVFTIKPDSLLELKGEILLLRRLENEDVKDGIKELLEEITKE